ncbi:Bug family tripartite tricarboxylate transporter substrate binding protein [Ramlibacter sp. AN1133]|uniref:Bug family tripartite tricarboxylate transporter substrate binding protein n=1 Tax=Ramlibacter sp. AN1133 TaxID=3133429 RepID=UPI0030BCCF19
MRNFTRAGALLAALALWACAVQAQQAYPGKAIRLVVPFVTGGATDIAARTIAVEMGQTLGQPVLVENRPGTAGALGADVVAKAAPDGYTLCLCTVGPLVTAPLVNPAVAYKPLQDLAPVSLVAFAELGVFARGDLPASSLQQLVEAARKAPGKFTFATTGEDGPNYMAFKLLERRAGMQLLHVPYKGDGQAVVALGGGEIDLFVGGLLSAQPLMKAGRVKAIALTGATRSASAPEVPTVAESGFPGFEHSIWMGVVVPAGTPAAVVDRLHKAIAAATRQPRVRETFALQGLVPVGGTPQEFGDAIRRDTAKYQEVLQLMAGAKK